MQRFWKWLVALLATAVLLAMAPASGSAADKDSNLARGKGTTPFGNASNGPFVISKINDGRLDTMGMWCTGGKPGSFGGVKLGDAPVTFNTVRFYLFNGRAACASKELMTARSTKIPTKGPFMTLN
jgi:hypothetical protein